MRAPDFGRVAGDVLVRGFERGAVERRLWLALEEAFRVVGPASIAQAPSSYWTIGK
jgi:hypothetical protein